MALSRVSLTKEGGTEYVVKVNEAATSHCLVNLGGRVVWQGHEYVIVTGTCPFFCMCSSTAGSN